MHNTILV